MLILYQSMFCWSSGGGLPYGFLIRSDTKQAVQQQKIARRHENIYFSFFLKCLFLGHQYWIFKVFLVTLENEYIKTSRFLFSILSSSFLFLFYFFFVFFVL